MKKRGNYKNANINQHMHNFGYDKLPRLWQSYCIFIGLSVILYFASIRAAKRYNFSFTGTEG